MLVLTRKLGEEILIGDNVKLIVNRIAGNRVTLGIKAPGNVTILRGELDSQAMSQDDGEPQHGMLATT
jgi:carbon storage regulator